MDTWIVARTPIGVYTPPKAHDAGQEQPEVWTHALFEFR